MILPFKFAVEPLHWCVTVLLFARRLYDTFSLWRFSLPRYRYRQKRSSLTIINASESVDLYRSFRQISLYSHRITVYTLYREALSSGSIMSTNATAKCQRRRVASRKLTLSKYQKPDERLLKNHHTNQICLAFEFSRQWNPCLSLDSDD